MSSATELVIKALLGFAAMWIVGKKLDLGPRAKHLLGGLALLAVLAFFNFGTFHQVGYAHHSELFHYVLGSKYFHELGYDGLYVASLEAQQEAAPNTPWPAKVRDLRNNRLVSDRQQLADHQREVRARFDDARWRSFVTDHQYFLDHSDPGYVAVMRKDHGYNPTPAWTVVARLFSSWLSVSYGSLLLLTLLDPLLLALMFVVVARTSDFNTATISLTVFGLAYLSRFYWVGGSFLRHDWLCAVVIGICMLERDKPIAAGAALGYAAALRVFPALFLFGIAVWALRCWLAGERRRWSLLLAAGFFGTVILGLLLGAAAGRGFEGWSEFVETMSVHRSSWSRNRVGLLNCMLSVYNFFTSSSDSIGRGELLTRVAEFHANWWLLRGLLVAATLAAVGRAAWRRGRVESAVLGLVAVFAVTEPSSYYWSMLLLVPLIHRRFLTVWILGLSALLCLFTVWQGVDNVYSLASNVMAAIWVAWLVPQEDAPSDEERVEAT